MNLVELKKKLKIIGVDSQAYCICEDVLDEQYCLDKKGRQWIYYYSERGGKTGERVFDNESDACEYFYALLESDPTARY